MCTDPSTPSISIIGCGAAGGSLAAALFDAGRRIDFVIDPDRTQAERVARRTGGSVLFEITKEVAISGVVIVAVPDPAIAAIATAAAGLGGDLTEQVWFHLSGALPASALDPLGRRVTGIGAFHPAHAFPSGQFTPIAPGTRFGVDGDLAALRTAEQLALDLGGKTVSVPGESRALYHAACVLSSNAVLGLIAEAKQLLQSLGIDGPDAEALLISLAKGTVAHAEASSLSLALTGPVRRGDAATVAGHLKALRFREDTANLYKVATRAVIQLARADTGAHPAALDRILSLLDGD